MLSYEELKKWSKDHSTQIKVAFCFVIIFLLGFGAGKAVSPEKKPVTKNNYTAKAVAEPAPARPEAESSKATSECVVKGSASSKIYHVKGGAFFERLKSPQCFASEEEAKAAGFRKSTR